MQEYLACTFIAQYDANVLIKYSKLIVKVSCYAKSTLPVFTNNLVSPTELPSFTSFSCFTLQKLCATPCALYDVSKGTKTSLRLLMVILMFLLPSQYVVYSTSIGFRRATTENH